MSQSLSSILIHLVFSTKNREPFITAAIQKELHPYLATILSDLKSPSLAIDGTHDHVHILFSLARIITVADLVEEIKTSSRNGLRPKDWHSEPSSGKEDMAAFPSGNRMSRTSRSTFEIKRFIIDD